MTSMTFAPDMFLLQTSAAYSSQDPMSAWLSLLNYSLVLFSVSCCRQQCAQSFHCDENVSYQIRMFTHIKDKLNFKEHVDCPELC